MMYTLFISTLILVALGWFAIQNNTPLIPLVFLGNRWPALPLSLWILGAFSLGLGSSLLLHILTQTPKRRPRQELSPEFEEEFEAIPKPPPRPRTVRAEPVLDYPAADWDLDDDQDWEPKPPPKPNQPESFTPKPRPETPLKSNQPDPFTAKPRPEAPPTQPKADSIPPTSQINPEVPPRPKPVPATKVYDANYRVLNAPFSPPEWEAEKQQADWSFVEEEDEDVFNFDGVPNPPAPEDEFNFDDLPESMPPEDEDDAFNFDDLEALPPDPKSTPKPTSVDGHPDGPKSLGS